jgi:hypothetical protein
MEHDMLTVRGEAAPFCDGIPRRMFLQTGVLSVASLSLADVLRQRAAAVEAGGSSRSTAVIFLELAGGPTQLETYDPKGCDPAGAQISGFF